MEKKDRIIDTKKQDYMYEPLSQSISRASTESDINSLWTNNLSNKDMSYSMLVDNKSNKDPLTTALPRKIHSWINDDSVDKCYLCKQQFYILVRRHHCRFCGRIFCHKCSDYYQNIPKDILLSNSNKNIWHNYIESYFTSIDTTKERHHKKPCSVSKERVCKVCNRLIDRLNAIKKWIHIFCLLDLDIKEIRNLAGVCKLWWYAANYYLSIFREIQYNLPIEEFTNIEKRMLSNNAKYCSGHSQYIVALLKMPDTEEEGTNSSYLHNVSMIEEVMKKPKKISCRMLMCTRNCSNKLSSTDSINILARCFRKKGKCTRIKEIALEHLDCTDIEFKCYIPFLVYNIRNDDDGILIKYLINKCINNFFLLNSLYWEIQLYQNIKNNTEKEIYTKFMNKIIGVLLEKKHEKNYIKLMEGDAFIKIIKNIGVAICVENKTLEEVQKETDLECNTTYPMEPSKRIFKICVDKIKAKNSISKPIIIPCLTDSLKTTRVMYKLDNLRNDQIILNIIKLMEVLVKKEEGIDLDIITYNILPMDGNSGMIEIVDNAETLYHIKEKLHTNVLNFIMEDNGNMTVQKLRSTFIKSTAAYCVITYLMGVGDRHLDNIMISKEGKLFHIDFGYILGNDTIFNNADIRLPIDALDACGGKHSKSYEYFEKICAIIFNCLRRNINIFMNMLLILPHISDIKLTEKQIIEQVYKRFIPGENDKDAKIHILKQLDNGRLSYKLKDFCHYHSQEKTLGDITERFKVTFFNIWKKFSSS